MIINSNGAIISGITNAAYSMLGDEYLAMLDDMGTTIHIKRTIIDYLHSIPVRKTPTPSPDPQSINPNDVFIK